MTLLNCLKNRLIRRGPAFAALLCLSFSTARAYDPNKPWIYSMRFMMDTWGYLEMYSTATVVSKSSNFAAFRVVTSTASPTYQLLVTTQGYVGIATASPGSLLDVNGTAQLRGSSGGTGLYVNSSGSVGVGTTGPASKLSVQGTGTSYGLFVSTDSAGGVGNLVVNNSGNVGIGTTVPGKTLSVNGTIENVAANAQILKGGGTSGHYGSNSGGIEVLDEGILTANGQAITYSGYPGHMGNRMGGLLIIACYRDFWGPMSGYATTWIYAFAPGAWGGTGNVIALISSVGDTANCAVTSNGGELTLTNNYATGATVHYRVSLYH